MTALFDKDGWLELDREQGGGHGAHRQDDGLIQVVKHGSLLFMLPKGFAPEHIIYALQTYYAGHAKGEADGRVKVQSEIKQALGIK